MAKYKPLGNPLHLEGKLWSGKGSAVPYELLSTVRQYPIPVTIGGSNNVTFTLKGSTRRIPIWHDNDLIFLDEDFAYTWDATSNDILDSSGAEATDTDSVLGVWYMYIAITLDSNSEWQYEMRPSQTAPEATEGPNGVTYLGHPGTSKEYAWRYVGFMVCTTAATPAFRAMVKSGYTYHFASQSVATTATWAALDFTASVPAINGIQVAGKLETGAAGTVAVSGSSVEDQGVLIHDVSGHVDNDVGIAPFGPIETDGSGQVYAKDTVARGDVHITQVVDLV